MNEKNQVLQNHMARLGAGLLILKNSGAPVSNPVSLPDRVAFQFEGERYEIVSSRTLREQRTATWRETITLVKQYAGSCPGHVQLQMFAALEAAALRGSGEGS